MRKTHVTASAAALSLMIVAAPAVAQDQGAAPSADAAPAGQGQDLPEVKVIQEQPKPQPVQQAAPKPKKATPKPRPVSAPQPAPVQQYEPVYDEFAAPAEISEPAQIMANSPYSATAGAGAAQRAQFGSIGPVSGKQMIPGDLQNFSGAGTNVSADDIEQSRPLTNQEALARVPGVVAVNDDGLGRHSGIGIRGSSYRRSRKILVMEDGVPINFATYLDSSTHYTPPLERVENIEVLRGNVVAYGPLNNFGVINFQNLSPFGENETVFKFGLGTTSGSDRDWNNMRHVHTRQSIDNWGVVASYSGAESGGAWDNEVLRYNDFHGSIGVKGQEQDLVLSGGFFRQRDRYDEDNFNGTRDQFFANGRNKGDGASGFFGEDAPDDPVTFGYNESNYNADFFRLQLAHNYYFDKDTTLSTRGYYNDHHRARFYPTAGDTNANLEMEGRDRHYQTYGVDSRIEFANRALWNGMTYDLLAGVRYEEQMFTNMNRESRVAGDILSMSNAGALLRKEELEAQSFAAFVEAAIHVTPSFTLTPGARLESYDVSYVRYINNGVPTGLPLNESEHTHLLPSISFAWEAVEKTTFYGGYFQGLTPHIVRDAREAGNALAFPLKEEVGDNFQLGVRSSGVRGFFIDMAVFHSKIDNYQFGEAFTRDVDGADRAFVSLDEVEVNGFEVTSRVDSRPVTGGPWNLFAQATYTYADVEISRGINEDGDSVAGNRAPESIRNSALLTLGIDFASKWDASISYGYRGSYFRNEDNTAENKIDGQWLLSARSNYKLNDMVTLWAVGQNLTNEFYVNEIADGFKPGQGRTLMGGVTIKFD